MSLFQQFEQFENRVHQLSNVELISELERLFQREKRLGDAILLGLKEIQQRRLFLELGYPSMFEFLVKHYKLSESSAYQRVAALKLMQALPEVQNSILKGEVTLSTAALAQSFIARSEKENQAPLTVEAKKDIVDLVKDKPLKEAQAALADKNPTLALPRNKEKPLTPTHTQLQVTLEMETMKLLNEVKALLSHSIPDGNWNEVLKAMAKISRETLKKKQGKSEVLPKDLLKSQKVESTHEEQAPSSTLNEESKLRANSAPISSEARNTKTKTAQEISTDDRKVCVRNRNIPISIRRKVFQRSGGSCEYVGSEGHRCNSQHQLEFDHYLRPWSQGGTHEEDGLRLLCSQHNKFRTLETHGFLFKK